MLTTAIRKSQMHVSVEGEGTTTDSEHRFQENRANLENDQTNISKIFKPITWWNLTNNTVTLFQWHRSCQN